MRILSFNIWHGQQKAQLRDFLVSQIEETDIFCFQEAIGAEAEELIADLFKSQYYQSVIAEKFIREDNHYYLMTIVKRPGSIVSSKELFEEHDLTTGRALMTDIAAADGSKLRVINVHGMAYPGHKLDTEGRLRQSQQIIKEAADSELPKIICGDFNLLPEAESVQTFRRAGYRDLVLDYNIPTTRNRLAWEKYPDNQQLFADYTFVSDSLEVLDFTVPNIEASDHLPMIIEIS